MRLKPEQIKKLTSIIYDKLQKEGLMKLRVSPAEVIKTIESIIYDDARLEDQLVAQARKMMDKFTAQVQSGEIDYQKMYGMILKQLMKNKKFTA